MRFARFVLEETIAYGVLNGALDDGDTEQTVTVIDGHPFGPHELTAVSVPMVDVRLLPPVLPTKIVGIGKNYADHAKEMDSQPPATPVMFLKPSTSVVGPRDAISLPAMSAQVEFEGELAIVIGRLAKDLPPGRVDDAVLGYTCANDVTARDLQRADGQWTRAKAFDGFCPLGPWISTDVDPDNLSLQTTVNGQVRQSSSTGEMIHAVRDLVAFVSSVMTLVPGDVILTGTPAGVGTLQHGDEVAVEIEGIGRLTNQVA
jgi:2-keto-4-pentenoate hydratase/2-oxohepta-3-ene-1,7-dioic acid hydratase in catechol pathway